MRDRAKQAAWQKAYRERHPEKKAAANKAYRERNHEKTLAKTMEWQRRNPDKVAASKRRQKYGLTQAQYEEKWSSQEGLCAICKGCFEKLNVDHCHETGKVRGLLCQSCNFMLGQAKDRIDRLQSAIAYLEYHADDAQEHSPGEG